MLKATPRARTEAFTYDKLPGLVYDRAAERWVRAGAVAYVKKVLDGLKKRFPDDLEMAALDIFDYTRMPSEGDWAEAEATYGDDEIGAVLCDCRPLALYMYMKLSGNSFMYNCIAQSFRERRCCETLDV